MKIEQTITATLEKEMDKRGVNYVGLSEELGIPRTTLQGYLKGTSHPRSDSLEELAEKLGLSLAELVSGEEYPTHTGVSGLDQLLAEFPALHPNVLPVAKDAFSLLQTAFRLSDELYDLDSPADEQEPDTIYRYYLHELTVPPHATPTYGILVKQRFQECWYTVAIVAAFSHDKAAVLRLIDRCTKLQLSPEHLLDVVHDFLTQQGLDF